MTAKWLRWLLLPILVLGAGRLMAACSVLTPIPVSLGSISSLSLMTTAQVASAGAGLRCNTVITLLTNNYVRATVQTTPLVLSDGNGNTIPFTISTASNGTQFQPGTPLVLSDVTILALLTQGTGMPLSFRVPAGPNVPAGTYTASVNVLWQYAICEGILVLCSWQRSPGIMQNCPLDLCGAPTNWGTGTVSTIQLRLVVSKACVINSTPNVNLGDRALISQFNTVTTSVAVTCTNTEGYTIGFTTGGNYQAPWRRLASGANRINYNLYFPGTNTVWNTTQTQSTAGTGLQQIFQFDTAVDPSQANVPAGEYIDNVTMIISY